MKYQRGFSLLELLIAVVLILIVGGMLMLMGSAIMDKLGGISSAKGATLTMAASTDTGNKVPVNGSAQGTYLAYLSATGAAAANRNTFFQVIPVPPPGIVTVAPATGVTNQQGSIPLTVSSSNYEGPVTIFVIDLATGENMPWVIQVTDN
jgi:prepilin-type N-terminal cleavage/methylation domain-containing protein